jgi:hypothetical protein
MSALELCRWFLHHGPQAISPGMTSEARTAQCLCVAGALVTIGLSGPAASEEKPAPLLFERAAIEAEFAAYFENPEASIPLIAEASRTFHDGCGFDGRTAPTCKEKSAEDWATRERGAATIVAMMDMLLEYERRGVGTHIVATPYWGHGADKEIPARDLRERVFGSVSSWFPRDRIFLPVLRWVFLNEYIERSRSNALIVLRSVKEEGATELLATIARGANSSEEEIVIALTELAKRDSDVAASIARQYVQDPRGKVRATSREVLAARGETLPGFDPVVAIEAFRTRFADATALLPEPVRQARLISFRLRPNNRAMVPRGEVRGFELASTDAARVRLLTTSLDFLAVDRSDINGDIVEVPLADEAERVASLRASALANDDDDEADAAFSRDGNLTAQFEPDGISGYEILLASELFGRGDAANAARVILPPVEASGDIDRLFAVYPARLAISLYHVALERFAGDRDYEGAAKLAGYVAEKFPKFPDHRTAARLADQLPKRLDEFRTFNLPKRSQWESESRRMSREEKIDWLCERVRLVNAFQDGQPGGVDFGEAQYAEPSGMINAAWSLHRGKTGVINPLRELETMSLTVKDVPILARHLEDDRLLPSVEFGRDFHPARTLYSTADVLGWQINDIANQKLLPRDGMEELDATARKELIASVVAWSTTNASRSDKDRLLDVVRQDQRWFAVSNQVKRDIVDRQLVEAMPLVLAYLDRKGVTTYEVQEILQLAAKLDGPGTVPAASARLLDPDPGVKLEAGIIVGQWGDKETGSKALREALREGTNSTLNVARAGVAVGILLSSGLAEDAAAAGVIFEKDYFIQGWDHDRAVAVKAFGDRGGLVARFYRSRLDTPGTWQKSDGKTVEAVPFSFRFAEEVVNQFGSSRVGTDWPSRGSRAERDAAFEKIRAWLDAEIARTAS